MPQTRDVSRDGPFDAYCSPMDTGDCPLVSTGLPGCPYRITSYTPRRRLLILTRLLFRSPAFWVQNMDTDDAVAAAVNLKCDAGLMSSNLQILCQFVNSLHWMSSEVLSLAMGQVVFPSSEVAALSPAPRASRAAHYMSAMGLWRPLVGPGGPGPLPTSSCNACINCRYCFLDGTGPSGN